VEEMTDGKNCGNCKHTGNKLGFIALHCDLICGTYDKGEYNDGKVRSWERCCFKPSKWVRR
jgi:hypothetical protein